MIELTGCPECGAPAEIQDRAVLESTDGPFEHVRVVCASRHRFFMPTVGLAQPSRTPGDLRSGRAGTPAVSRPGRA